MIAIPARSVSALLSVAAFMLGSSACNQRPGARDAGAPDDAAAGDLGAVGDGAVESDMAMCASQTLCGPTATCCAVGDECVADVCTPACAMGVRCAAVCCPAGDVCLSSACTAPLGPCADSFDCADNQFCEPTLGQCLPQPPGGATCEYRPPVAPYSPVLGWSWTDSTIMTGYNQVINVPAVIDIDGDKIPDVLIVTSKASGAGSSFLQTDLAYLRALDGKTGLEKWPATAGVYQAGNELNPRATPAVADLEGDGTIEIVGVSSAGGLIAFNADGSLRWRSTKSDGVTAYTGSFNSVTVAIADMDHDGKAEIVAGGVVLDYTGKIISGLGREHLGENVAGYGAVSIIADVDGDGIEDVVTGRAAFKLGGATIYDCVDNPYCGNGSAPPDGYAAISDLDGDGAPEVVVIAAGTVRVQNAKTGHILTSLALPGTGAGGPPTIADFNGDGKMDISSANGNSYNVFTYSALPTPTLTVLWGSPTQDLSSNVTGSSVFDFEGDGKAEVVYNDECFLRVYSGPTGAVLFQTPSSSATIHEYPVVVDVDGDNHTELVVASNDRNTGPTTCPLYTAGQAPRHGLFVYRDANNKWVRTRKLWNQHAYHVTNINSDGTLPKPEPASWITPPGLNNYRVSTQGVGVFNAPDLEVDLELFLGTCPSMLTLRASVKNEGSLGVAAGVKVDFYRGTDATGVFLGEKTTTTALLPGAAELVDFPYDVSGAGPLAFYVSVNGASGDGGEAVDECNYSNNGAGVSGSCPSIQ
jgi:hypothetical protein